MGIRVTLDIFSGRPNPVVELDGEDADNLVAEVDRIRPTAARAEQAPFLGYRGLVMERLGRTRARPIRIGGQSILESGAGSPDERQVERMMLRSTGLFSRVEGGGRATKIARRLLVEREAMDETRSPAKAKAREPAKRLTAARAKTVRGCERAPLFEPDWWNDQGIRQADNNCYNYATDHRTDTFAQPGRASGPFVVTSTCETIRNFAIRDNLIDAPDGNNICPREGHLVALVLWPGTIDFHWYRKGRDGLWTHKPGPTPVTNLDNSGQTIQDPRSADRGPYTSFCGFLIVRPGHVKLV